MKEVTEVQKLQLELIKRSSFNNFDGEQVVKDLLGNTNLWKSCIIDCDVTGNSNLIKLRDMHLNFWNTDTLYIIPTGVNDLNLQYLAEQWSADGIIYITPEETSILLGCWPSTERILKIWWD